jgi:hypothetical protein
MRYPVARRIALALAPLLRRSPLYGRRASLLDGPREETLRMVLRTMTRAQVAFDPEVLWKGSAFDFDQAALFVGGHYLLNITMSRRFHDAGKRLALVVAAPREPVYYFGTPAPIENIYGGTQMFVQIRNKLREGASIFFTIEDAEQRDGYAACETVAGTRYVSRAALQFALRVGAPLIFAATYLDAEGRITVTLEKPRTTDAEGLTAEYRDFLRRHVAAVRR